MKLFLKLRHLFLPFLYFKDFRMNIRLFSSFVGGGAFVCVNLVLFFVTRSALSLAAAGYYLSLALPRFWILKLHRSADSSPTGAKISRAVGASLLILNMFFAVLMPLCAVLSLRREYSPAVIIPQVAFPVICLIGAGGRLFFRASRTVTEELADAVSLSAALFSSFNLASWIFLYSDVPVGRNTILAIGVACLFAVSVLAVRVIGYSQARANGKKKPSA